MKTHQQEVMVMYHPRSTKARQTIAYAHTMSKHVKEWNFDKDKMTATMWRRLIRKLNMEPKQLLDKSHPYYQEHIRGRDFDDEGWLNVICRNSYLLKGPIVIKGKKAHIVLTPTDIFSILKDEKVALGNQKIIG